MSASAAQLDIVKTYYAAPSIRGAPDHTQSFLHIKDKFVNEGIHKEYLFLSIKNSDSHFLTKREIEIISLWLSGYSIKESAAFLNISLRTVEEYRARVKDKFSVKNKKCLYELAIKQQILDIYFQIAKVLAQ